MKYLFVLSFVLCFVLFDAGIGYTQTSPLWTHFTYQFQHEGFFHLSANSFSFIGMFRLLEKFLNKWLLFVLTVTIGFVASFLSMYDVPTVGASAMVYAMIGIFFSMISLCRDMKIIDGRKFALFVAGVIICLTVGAMNGNSNFFLHVFALMIGTVAGIMVAFFREEW
jgi:membrane associated rhomboid family serine protease